MRAGSQAAGLILSALEEEEEEEEEEAISPAPLRCDAAILPLYALCQTLQRAGAPLPPFRISSGLLKCICSGIHLNAEVQGRHPSLASCSRPWPFLFIMLLSDISHQN